MKEDLEILNHSFKDKSPADILRYFLENYKGKVALGSSLGAEDQVLTDMVAKIDKNIKIFTLDTGRLFPEAYQLIEKTNRTYQISIDVYFPDTAEVEKMVKEKGINLFYNSIENRKLCCHIRKIEPSKRALMGMEVWITGIRKDQTVSRFFNKHVEWDEANSLIKINHLLNWTEKQVWEYIKSSHVPYNQLHEKGFPSIGCMPCTRKVKSGEDARSGRWWWEGTGHKECGLHNGRKDKNL